MTQSIGSEPPTDSSGLEALDAMLDEVGSYEPLMTYPVAMDDEDADWAGALDAMIAAGLLHPY